MKESRTPPVVILIFAILVIVALLFNSSRENEKMREKYFEEGYKAAQKDVYDWFDDDYYYLEIYERGYSSGYTAGFDRAIETVDDWYE